MKIQLKNLVIINRMSLFFMICLTIACTSCSEKSNTTSPIYHDSGINLGSTLTMQDVYNAYDTTNITGLIKIYNTYADQSKVNSGTLHTFTQQDYEAISSFFKVDTAYLTYACAGITINGESLTSIATGSEIYAFQGDFLNFGSGTNRIIISNSPPNIPSSDTSLALPSPLRITSLTRGDTIDNASNLTINWTGYPSATEYATLTIVKQTELNDTSAILQGDAVVVNNGSFTITSTIMGNLSEGYYDVVLTGYHPQFIALSNGKKVAVVYRDQHVVSIYIK